MTQSNNFVPPHERLDDLADRVMPEIEAAIEQIVGQSGEWTKSRADTLNSLNRLLTCFVDFSRSAAERKRLAEEDEKDVATILDAIDQRIVELALAFAERLVGAEPLAPAG